MVVESAAGIELLLDVGLARRITGSAEVELSAGDQRWSRRQVLLLRHSPSPAELDRALASVAKSHYDGLLFVVGTGGSTLTDVAERDPRIAYAGVDQGIVSFLGRTYRAGKGNSGTVARRARVSWTRLAVLRLFALRPQDPLTQSAIANRIGVVPCCGRQTASCSRRTDRTDAGGWPAPALAACWDAISAD